MTDHYQKLILLPMLPQEHGINIQRELQSRFHTDTAASHPPIRGLSIAHPSEDDITHFQTMQRFHSLHSMEGHCTLRNSIMDQLEENAVLHQQLSSQMD
jgi:hypothetical protein